MKVISMTSVFCHTICPSHLEQSSQLMAIACKQVNGKQIRRNQDAIGVKFQAQTRQPESERTCGTICRARGTLIDVFKHREPSGSVVPQCSTQLLELLLDKEKLWVLDPGCDCPKCQKG